MTKRKLEALGKCFAAEIEGSGRGWGRQYQSGANVFKELEAQGLVQHTRETLHGWPVVTIEGWELTKAGRIVYCQGVDTTPL